MKCPKCGSETKVKDSRRPIDAEIHRRRECTSCGHRFSTIEAELRTFDPAVKRQGYFEGRSALASQVKKLHDQLGELLK